MSNELEEYKLYYVVANLGSYYHESFWTGEKFSRNKDDGKLFTYEMAKKISNVLNEEGFASRHVMPVYCKRMI